MDTFFSKIKKYEIKKYDFASVKVGEQIGGGGFGSVYKCKVLGKDRACKRLYFEMGDSKVLNEFLCNLLHELILSTNLKSKRFTKVYGISYDKDNYELYNDNLIEIELYNSAGDVFKYNFDKNDKSYSLNLGTLLPDNYSFKVIVSGSNLIKTGVFNVQNIQIEDVNLIADYNFLKNLSSSNNGDIYLLDDINVLINDMLLTGDKKIIKLTNKQFQIIDLTWILFFLLSYIFIEWFIRKYNGLI